MLDNCINFGMNDEDPTMTRLAVREAQIKNALHNLGSGINSTADSIGHKIMDPININRASKFATDISTGTNDDVRGWIAQDKYRDLNEATNHKAIGYEALGAGALGSIGATVAAEQLAQGALHGTGLARRLAIGKAAKSNAIGSYNKSIGKLETKKSEYLTDGKKVSGIDKKIDKLTKVRDNISDKLNAKVDSDISALRTKLAVAKSRGDTVTVARITRKLADLQTNYK